MVVRLMPFVLLLAGVIAFWPYLDGPFVLDDRHSIEQNLYIREHVSPLYFFRNPQSASIVPSTMTRPLLTFSYALHYWFNLDDPQSFRLVNLLIHVINSIFIMLLTARAGRLKKAAPLCGIMFLLLPLNAIGVAYISCRSTLLAAAFYLAGLLLFVRAWESSTRLSRRRMALTALGICLFYAAGIFTKPTASTLPAAVIIWALAFSTLLPSDKKSASNRFAFTVAVSLVAVFCLFLVYRQVHAAPVLFPPSRPWPVWQYAAAEVRAFFTYISLMVFPLNLSLEHQAWMPEATSALLSARFLLPAATLGVLIIVAVRFLRKLPELAFPALFAVVWLLPTSSIVPLNVLVSENRPYLSSLLMVWVFAFFFEKAREKRPRAAPAVAAAVLVLFTSLVWSRAAVFESELSLWKDTVRKAPALARPWANLGSVMLSYGRSEEAKKYFQRALEMDPCNPSALNNLGNIAMERGKRDRAERLYRRALRCDPENTAALLNLSRLLESSGREQEARTLQEKIEAIPGRLQYLRKKGLVPD
ncbi:MAG: tetratricopeptide repeat protein [bacterium]